MSSADTTSCPGLLQNLDVFGIVASYLPIPSLLHCAQTCHLANIQVRREIRSKLSQFLAATTKQWAFRSEKTAVAGPALHTMAGGHF